METKVSQESLQSRLSFFTTGSSFQATETILATGTTIWKPAFNTHRCYIQKAKDPDEIRKEKRTVQLARREKRRRQQGGEASKGLRPLCCNTETEDQEKPDEYKEPLLVFFDVEAM